MIAVFYMTFTLGNRDRMRNFSGTQCILHGCFVTWAHWRNAAWNLKEGRNLVDVNAQVRKGGAMKRMRVREQMPDQKHLVRGPQVEG